MNFQNSPENLCLDWGSVLPWDQVRQDDWLWAQVFWFTSVEAEIGENDFPIEGILQTNWVRQTGDS